MYSALSLKFDLWNSALEKVCINSVIQVPVPPVPPGSSPARRARPSGRRGTCRPRWGCGTRSCRSAGSCLHTRHHHPQPIKQARCYFYLYSHQGDITHTRTHARTHIAIHTHPFTLFARSPSLLNQATLTIIIIVIIIIIIAYKSTQNAAGLKAFGSLLPMGATECANHDPAI